MNTKKLTFLLEFRLKSYHNHTLTLYNNYLYEKINN